MMMLAMIVLWRTRSRMWLFMDVSNFWRSTIIVTAITIFTFTIATIPKLITPSTKTTKLSSAQTLKTFPSGVCLPIEALIKTRKNRTPKKLSEKIRPTRFKKIKKKNTRKKNKYERMSKRVGAKTALRGMEKQQLRGPAREERLPAARPEWCAITWGRISPGGEKIRNGNRKHERNAGRTDATLSRDGKKKIE